MVPPPVQCWKRWIKRRKEEWVASPSGSPVRWANQGPKGCPSHDTVTFPTPISSFVKTHHGDYNAMLPQSSGVTEFQEVFLCERR